MKAHNHTVNWVASSPVEDAFVTCSDDNSAKLWLNDPTTAQRPDLQAPMMPNVSASQAKPKRT
jgi:WD40 repeat protein